MKELLIEKWFPLYETNIESSRERGGPNILPPLYFLHIWWARRPITAARIASVLASLPFTGLTDEDKKKLLWAMGLRGDPIKAHEKIVRGGKGFGYPMFESVNPDPRIYLGQMIELWGRKPIGADFMAGGGTIPFEMIRAGYGDVVAGEYNPVAYLILKASLEYPIKYGSRLVNDVERHGKRILNEIRHKFAEYYPPHPKGQPNRYIWVRMFKCPQCGVEIPALKTLWLDKEKNYALLPEIKGNNVMFRIVKVKEIGKVKVNKREESKVRVIEGEFKGREFITEGFEKDGELICPRYRHVVSDEEVKRQYKEFLEERERKGYYCSHPAKLVAAVLSEGVYVEPTPQMIEAYNRAEETLAKSWDTLVAENLVPQEVHEKGEADRVVAYGLDRYYKMFNARQLLVYAEIIRLIRNTYSLIIEEEIKKGKKKEDAEDYAKAVITYLALMLGKTLDYNSVLTLWDNNSGKIVHTFDTHAYAWTWDYGEADAISEDIGFVWMLNNLLKALRGIVKRLEGINCNVKVIYGDAERLALESIPQYGYDVIFIDPPYLGNVQYAEISEYFYVWFKRILKNIYPEVFSDPEVPKSEEAVANKVRHGSEDLGKKYYVIKMERIFRNVYTALRDDGVFLLWFAHKTGEAWAKTVEALLNAGFLITSMWGIRSEMERSLHISGKAALRTSIIFVCRKRERREGYIQDALREIDKNLELRLNELDNMGLIGPDFIMGAQAEALRIASAYWPLKDPAGKLTASQALDLILERATGIAINYLTRKVAPQIIGVDAVTKFHILARYLYGDLIPYDEARRLALACLGASAIGDPVEEVVLKSGIGKISQETIKEEKAKVVRLLWAWDRVKQGLTLKYKPTPIIDWIHLAIAGLEEGKRREEVAAYIAEGGGMVGEVLKVLYHLLPEDIGEKEGKNLAKERMHVKTLLLSIYEEGLHLAVKKEMEEKKTQKTLDEYW